MPIANLTHFTAGDAGSWRISRLDAVTGESLPPAAFLAIQAEAPGRAAWSLSGLVSNVRYACRGELEALESAQEGLGRPAAAHAALIPIRKSPAWWALAQDERRALIEEASHHIRIGMDYLPAVARRLYHSRDLGEPFDFLTWFEFAPDDAGAFETLVERLRATEEWRFVEREVDIRLERV